MRLVVREAAEADVAEAARWYEERSPGLGSEFLRAVDVALAEITRMPERYPVVRGKALEYVDLATRLDDLRVPPGNRLHALERERKGQHAIAVNDQWRICFRFADGDAYDVEITDYH